MTKNIVYPGDKDFDPLEVARFMALKDLGNPKKWKINREPFKYKLNLEALYWQTHAEMTSHSLAATVFGD